MTKDQFIDILQQLHYDANLIDDVVMITLADKSEIKALTAKIKEMRYDSSWGFRIVEKPSCIFSNA